MRNCFRASNITVILKIQIIFPFRNYKTEAEHQITK